MNSLEFFTPLMHKDEYTFLEKYLNPNDILLEWGSGNGTLYFSGLVKKVISIEHDIDWYNMIKKVIELFDIKNIEQYHIPAHTPNPVPCRYAQFKDYIEFPKQNNLQFTKVLIDGRARKYCARSIADYINQNCVVFIHDFNREDYQKVLKYYDKVDVISSGQGIVALKRKDIIEKSENGEY